MPRACLLLALAGCAHARSSAAFAALRPRAPARYGAAALRLSAATPLVGEPVEDVAAAAPVEDAAAAAELPPRPKMTPGFVSAEAEDAAALSYDALQAAAPAATLAAPAAPPKLPDFELEIEKLKNTEDFDGLGRAVGDAIGAVCGKTVRTRLWTKADFMHIHAVTGGWFLFVGIPWLVVSHLYAFARGAGELAAGAGPGAFDALGLDYTSGFLGFLAATGVVNALSAIPMSKFKSDKLFDLSDLKANGFTLGGTGLTLMCAWGAWWFSGSYPGWLHPLDGAFWVLWLGVCVGTTINWETMLQQNFEANERTGRKFAKVSEAEMREKTILYRLASWPNLTQLLFLASPCLGGTAWFERTLEAFPMERVPMYHYCIASAMGYALSMFSETLRDRKLVTLRTDLIILIIGFVFPMVSVGLDGLTYGSSVSVYPPDYWYLWGH